jgi:hypothetical protein
MSKPWLDKEKFLEIYNRTDVYSDEDIANVYRDMGYNVSRRAITDARNAFGIEAKSKNAIINVEQISQNFDKDEIWRLVIELQNALRKENEAIVKKNVHVHLEKDEPYGIFFMGDLHIGDIGTDHSALLRDIDLIRKTENLYGTLGGDYINNFIKPNKKIKNTETVPIEMAWSLFEDVLVKLENSLLMVLTGNHDDWTDQLAEIDKVGNILKNIGVPYGKHGANLHLHFPDGQTYKIRLRHKFRFESSLNILSAVKQMYRFDEPFDIGVLHHLHTPSFEMWLQEGKPCWAVRPGTYKIEDDYAYREGYTGSGIGMSSVFGQKNSCFYTVPMAILYPGERRIHMSPTIHDGVEYLSYAREQYKRKGNKK